MGRQVIGQNADYPRLRNLFISVIGTGIILSGIRFGLLSNFTSQPSVLKRDALTSPQPTAPPKRSYRPGYLPSGTIVPKVTRSNYNYLPLIDMNDRGDYLFLSSPNGSNYRQYLHVFNGKSVLSDKLATLERWGLTPNGSIVKRNDLQSPFLSGRMNSGLTNWAFNEIRFFRRYTDDGSMKYISSSMHKKVLTSRFLKDKPGEPSRVYYTSKYPLTILDIDDQDQVWVRESTDPNKATQDHLLKFRGESFDRVPLPPGYGGVDRIACTGSMIAGTFGNSTGPEPYRSFIRSQSGWKELPIPQGFVFSFVQKIFNNGLILGFVTDENRQNLRQVVWKDDSICLLNDLPAWPKQGQFSIVTRATRGGDIYVRSVLNTENGASEYYLLNVNL